MHLYMLVLILSTSLYADIKIINEGDSYEFAEKDITVAIQERIVERKPFIEKEFNNLRKKAKSKVMNYKPSGIDKLTPAKLNRSFEPNMNYVLEMDIPDSEGRILYPKGFTYKITDFISLPYEIIVIDPTEPLQLQWLIKNNLHKKTGVFLMVTDGQPLKLNKQFKRAFYFCTEAVQKRFQLKHTPSRITQLGNVITVKEIALNEYINKTQGIK